MNGSVILVTGATAGIGRAAALELARAGHHVFATGRRTEALAALVREASGLKLEAMVLDVTNQASIEHAKAEIERRTDGHGVDVVVNNAGYGLVGPLEDISDEALRKQYDTNVFGLMAVTRAFLPTMRARGRGRIVNVSSMGGRVTFPFMGAYNSTKYAVESLSDALRIELRPFGIEVSLIEPGAIKTEFADVAIGGAERKTGSAWTPAIEQADAMRAKFDATAVGPEVVARAIVHAATARRPRPRYVVPKQTWGALVLFRVIPTRMMDAILGWATGITRKKLLPAASSESSSPAAA